MPIQASHDMHEKPQKFCEDHLAEGSDRARKKFDGDMFLLALHKTGVFVLETTSKCISLILTNFQRGTSLNVSIQINEKKRSSLVLTKVTANLS